MVYTASLGLGLTLAGLVLWLGNNWVEFYVVETAGWVFIGITAALQLTKE